MSPLVYSHHPVFAAVGDAISFNIVYDQRLMGWNSRPLMEAPPVNQEYFEWVDLVDALRTSGERFVMLELGAGYGRWGLRAAHMAKRLSKRDVEIRFVEAEPQHARWAREAIEANGLKDYKMKVIEAAVAYHGRSTRFPFSYQDLSASNWYGQAIGWDDSAPQTGETYFGKPVFQKPGGYALIEVETITLEQLTNDLDRIDLIDMDIQGAEKDIIQNSIDTLNRKVRRVHIGTHSADIEDVIRRAFLKAGWWGIWDFSYNNQYVTAYGPVKFNDGVQSWINPQLERR
jgi:FkbM family methyltransferase